MRTESHTMIYDMKMMVKLAYDQSSFMLFIAIYSGISETIVQHIGLGKWLHCIVLSRDRKSVV